MNVQYNVDLKGKEREEYKWVSGWIVYMSMYITMTDGFEN
jgi:hypothetical protein